ncbi:MAG: dTDP-glucose 4,6-dehydratase [Nitrososphaeria archaeon]
MKILVTGGCGFIGSNFIRYLLKEHPDWRVVNLDKLTYAGNLKNLEGIEEDSRYRFIRGDIADRALVERLFSEERFDAVVNFAAESHVDRSLLDPSPFIETNVKGVQVLLEAARKYPVWRFVQISTDEVYGSLGPEGKFTEESPLLPNSPYAASKAAADLLCRSYYKAYGIPVIITRSSNNYGPYQFPEKLIPFMIWNALKGNPLPVYGQGENVRDWLYVEDNCRAIDLVLRKGRVGEVYNIGGGFERRNIDVVRKICLLLSEELKKPSEEFLGLIAFIKDPRGKAHDFRYALDCKKIRTEVGWEPSVDFEEGLKRTVRWYLEHKDWIESVITGEYHNYYVQFYGKEKLL